MEARMTEIFQGLGGFEYDTSGLMRSSLDYHRLITFAANQGHDKQIALVDEFSLNYHCLGKYIGDRQVLLDAAEKVGIVGAAELLEDSNKGLKEVNEEFEKHSSLISGVPHFVIDGRYKLSCGQPPEVFLGGFQAVANDNSV